MKCAHPKVLRRRDRIEARAQARARRRELRAERAQAADVERLRRSLAALSPEERAALLGAPVGSSSTRRPTTRANPKKKRAKKATKKVTKKRAKKATKKVTKKRAKKR
ncbi:MAG: hypothetical protein SangKO_031820 [Sandaracinaceae bacterium]